MKCLSKVPSERYQRGNDLADALIGYLAGTGGGGDDYRAAWLSRRLGITPSVS
jgi:hypothetical protein